MEEISAKSAKKKTIVLGAIAVLLAVVIVLVFVLFNQKSNLAQGQVVINNKIVNVEVAKTAEEKLNGLKGRTRLGDNSGMLFVFEDKKYHNFWMQGMQIPVDIIWISDNKVVDITKNVPVAKDDTDLPIYRPSQEVDYVLEVNAGFADKNGLKIDADVSIRL